MSTVIKKTDFGGKPDRDPVVLGASERIPTGILDIIGEVKVLPEILATKPTTERRHFQNQKPLQCEILSWTVDARTCGRQE
jgi:hypothetical protein